MKHSSVILKVKLSSFASLYWLQIHWCSTHSLPVFSRSRQVYIWCGLNAETLGVPWPVLRLTMILSWGIHVLLSLGGGKKNLWGSIWGDLIQPQWIVMSECSPKHATINSWFCEVLCSKMQDCWFWWHPCVCHTTDNMSRKQFSTLPNIGLWLRFGDCFSPSAQSMLLISCLICSTGWGEGNKAKTNNLGMDPLDYFWGWSGPDEKGVLHGLK